MIKVQGVAKYLNEEKILDEINLNVSKGSIYGLIGPNGAGKTTLIKTMVDIYKPDEGMVIIDACNINNDVSVKCKIGYLPDFSCYYPQFSLKDMVSIYKDIYPSWNEGRYKALREIFCFDERKKLSKISKGMNTQVSLLLNLSIMPKVLIMDEPTSGLDPVIRKEVLNLIVQDVSQNETSVLISTHNLGELEQVCDHIGIINKGRILLENNLDDMKENVKKIQVAFKDDIPDELVNHEDILKIEKQGRVYYIVVNNHMDKILGIINSYNPLLIDTINMTLEEIFIYKMGGEGYEFKDIAL